MKNIVFNVTENHIKLIKKLNINYFEGELCVSIIDMKTPFGSKNMHQDMAEILNIKMPDKETKPEKYEQTIESLKRGFSELRYCIQILCQTLSLKKGTYASSDYGFSWELKEEG